MKKPYSLLKITTRNKTKITHKIAYTSKKKKMQVLTSRKMEQLSAVKKQINLYLFLLSLIMTKCISFLIN